MPSIFSLISSFTKNQLMWTRSCGGDDEGCHPPDTKGGFQFTAGASGSPICVDDVKIGNMREFEKNLN